MNADRLLLISHCVILKEIRMDSTFVRVAMNETSSIQILFKPSYWK